MDIVGVVRDGLSLQNESFGPCRAISKLPMQHFAVTDVYTPKLCPLVKFGVITCPLCGPVGPGVTSRVLALTETDIEPLLEIRWS